MPGAQVIDELLRSEHADVGRESVGVVVAELMEAEVAAQIGAERGEVSSGRVTQRNGYRPRPLDTRAGEIDLAIPKLRQGSYVPSLLHPRRRDEQALVAVVQEAQINGPDKVGGVNVPVKSPVKAEPRSLRDASQLSNGAPQDAAWRVHQQRGRAGRGTSHRGPRPLDRPAADACRRRLGRRR